MDGTKSEKESELTSTEGNIMSTLSEEEKNDTNDATPTSSTDANTASTASKIISDDPISSTSSDTMEKSSLNISQVSVDVVDKESSVDHEAELLEINLGNERITEDVEDLVHDLESLLGESTDSFIMSKNVEETKSITDDAIPGTSVEVSQCKIFTNSSVADIEEFPKSTEEPTFKTDECKTSVIDLIKSDEKLQVSEIMVEKNEEIQPKVQSPVQTENSEQCLEDAPENKMVVEAVQIEKDETFHSDPIDDSESEIIVEKVVRELPPPEEIKSLLSPKKTIFLSEITSNEDFQSQSRIESYEQSSHSDIVDEEIIHTTTRNTDTLETEIGEPNITINDIQSERSSSQLVEEPMLVEESSSEKDCNIQESTIKSQDISVIEIKEINSPDHEPTMKTEKVEQTIDETSKVIQSTSEVEEKYFTEYDIKTVESENQTPLTINEVGDINKLRMGEQNIKILSGEPDSSEGIKTDLFAIPTGEQSIDSNETVEDNEKLKIIEQNIAILPEEPDSSKGIETDQYVSLTGQQSIVDGKDEENIECSVGAKDNISNILDESYTLSSKTSPIAQTYGDNVEPEVSGNTIQTINEVKDEASPTEISFKLSEVETKTYPSDTSDSVPEISNIDPEQVDYVSSQENLGENIENKVSENSNNDNGDNLMASMITKVDSMEETSSVEIIDTSITSAELTEDFKMEENVTPMSHNMELKDEKISSNEVGCENSSEDIAHFSAASLITKEQKYIGDLPTEQNSLTENMDVPEVDADLVKQENKSEVGIALEAHDKIDEKSTIVQSSKVSDVTKEIEEQTPVGDKRLPSVEHMIEKPVNDELIAKISTEVVSTEIADNGSSETLELPEEIENLSVQVDDIKPSSEESMQEPEVIVHMSSIELPKSNEQLFTQVDVTLPTAEVFNEQEVTKNINIEIGDEESTFKESQEDNVASVQAEILSNEMVPLTESSSDYSSVATEDAVESKEPIITETEKQKVKALEFAPLVLSEDDSDDESVPTLALDPNSPSDEISPENDEENIVDQGILPTADESLVMKPTFEELPSSSIDVQENLETILAVAALQKIDIPKESEPVSLLSDNERREMEALQRAVESITDLSDNPYVEDVNDLLTESAMIYQEAERIEAAIDEKLYESEESKEVDEENDNPAELQTSDVEPSIVMSKNDIVREQEIQESSVTNNEKTTPIHNDDSKDIPIHLDSYKFDEYADQKDSTTVLTSGDVADIEKSTKDQFNLLVDSEEKTIKQLNNESVEVNQETNEIQGQTSEFDRPVEEIKDEKILESVVSAKKSSLEQDISLLMAAQSKSPKIPEVFEQEISVDRCSSMQTDEYSESKEPEEESLSAAVQVVTKGEAGMNLEKKYHKPSEEPIPNQVFNNEKIEAREIPDTEVSIQQTTFGTENVTVAKGKGKTNIENVQSKSLEEEISDTSLIIEKQCTSSRMEVDTGETVKSKEIIDPGVMVEEVRKLEKEIGSGKFPLTVEGESTSGEEKNFTEKEEISDQGGLPEAVTSGQETYLKVQEVISGGETPNNEKVRSKRFKVPDQETSIDSSGITLETVIKTKANERPKRHKKVDSKLEQLSINVDVPDGERTYSPKISIKPIRPPDDEVSTTSVSDPDIVKGSLKMTITKQSDKLHSVLKVVDTENQDIHPVEHEEPIPKYIIKSKMQQAESQHSPKMSTRSTRQSYSPTTSGQRSLSPRITIKPVVKPDNVEPLSPIKIKIGLKSDESSKKKVTIKPLTKTDDVESRMELSPRITIKPIPKPEVELIPKLNIKALKKAEEDSEESERSSPKIIIKPIIKPPEESQSTEEEGDIVKERIVLKINKGNLPTPSKDSKKREYPQEDEKSEKLAKITLKLSKEGGHPHIVHQVEEGSKRQYEDQGGQLENRKKQKSDAESVASTRSKHKDHGQVEAFEAPHKHKDPPHDYHIDIKRTKREDYRRSVVRPKEADNTDDIQIIEPKLNSPIVISEDSRSQDSSVIILDDFKEDHAAADVSSSLGVNLDVSRATPGRSESVLSANSPMSGMPSPRKRGRPRKVPVEVREEFKEQEEPSKLAEDNSAAPEPPKVHESGRPKRSCVGQSVCDTLGIKPRKPRGPGRGRGGKRGMGNRSMMNKEPSVENTILNFQQDFGSLQANNYSQVAIEAKRDEDIIGNKDLTILIDDSDDVILVVEPDVDTKTTPTARGGKRKYKSRGKRKSVLASTSNLLVRFPQTVPTNVQTSQQILQRSAVENTQSNNVVYSTQPTVSSTVDAVTALRDPLEIEAGSQELIGKAPSAGNDLLQEGNIEQMKSTSGKVEEVPYSVSENSEIFSSEVIPQQGMPASILPLLNTTEKLRNPEPSLVTSSSTLPSEMMMVDEDTRMSADISSRAQTPAKQVVVPMEIVVEESQSSIHSNATTESGKIQFSRPSKAARLEVQESDNVVVTADLLTEYHWNGNGPFMIQEQVAQFLGIKSFKRKYPNIPRRILDMQERDYVRENGFVTENMCDLGLTSVNSADILDIMYSDFQEKYEEYCKHLRDKQAKELITKQRALSLAASHDKNKADILKQAVQSAALWNARFNKSRKDERKACMDLQTLTVNYPKGRMKQIKKASVGNYPVAVVPGQFTDYYEEFTPTQINNLPLNTLCYDNVSFIPREHFEDSGSESSDSESGSSGSSSSGSDSDSSSGIDDCKLCKHTPSKKANVK